MNRLEMGKMRRILVSFRESPGLLFWCLQLAALAHHSK